MAAPRLRLGGHFAGVAELADAQDLGSCGRKAVQVRFLSPAFSRALHIRPSSDPSVGLLGLYYHASVDLTRADTSLFGAPVFAPLLFTDMAVLAFIGLAVLDARLRANTPCPQVVEPVVVPPSPPQSTA